MQNKNKQKNASIIHMTSSQNSLDDTNTLFNPLEKLFCNRVFPKAKSYILGENVESGL